MNTLTFKVDKYQILEEEQFDLYNPSKEKTIRVHFSSPVKHKEQQYNGIYLPLNLQEQTTADLPNNWLTDDNVAFILKNQDYEANITKDSAGNIYLGNTVGVRTDLTHLNHLNELAKKAEKSRASSEELSKLQTLSKEVKNGISKYVILPLALGKHPQNHWGMLVVEKYTDEGKVKPNIRKVYWTSSKNNLIEEVPHIKALVSFVASGAIADNINITTLDGEKQDNEADSGIYLCLYIKEILEYKTRTNKAVGEVLALTRNYNLGISDQKPKNEELTIPSKGEHEEESKTVEEWHKLGQISEDESWDLLDSSGIWSTGKYTLKELKQKLVEITLVPKPGTEKANKTLEEWLNSGDLTDQQYELLLKGYCEDTGDDLWVEEVDLDPNYSYSWEEVYNHLQKAQKWDQKEQEEQRKKQEIAEKMDDGENWKDIHPDFNEELKKEWVEAEFNYSQARDWIGIGIKPDEHNADFCAWLRDEKKVAPDWVLNYGNIEQLRGEYESTFTEYE